MFFTRTGASLSEARESSTAEAALMMRGTWVRGPEVPPELLGEDCLTPDDHRDITLDHINRTSEVVWKLEIRLVAAA
jgi:hypothetical protein